MLALVSDLNGIRANQNEVILLEGIYIQNDVRMRRRRPAVLYRGHVAIELADKTKVYLYPPSQLESLREKNEIDAFENQRVLLECKAVPYIPQNSIHAQQASLPIAPCIVELISILAVK